MVNLLLSDYWKYYQSDYWKYYIEFILLSYFDDNDNSRHPAIKKRKKLEKSSYQYLES